MDSKFPDCKGKITYSAFDADSKDKEADESALRAEVWEIWDKASMRRLYVTDGCEDVLRSDDDPYNIHGFFPCRSLYGLITTDSLIPVPEFLQWQDQANELDRVNTRIQKNIETLKYCGVYDKSIPESDILGDMGNLEDGQFLPFNGAGLEQRGGMANAFMVRDFAPIITALSGLRAQRTDIMETIYQLTGISDLQRGAQGQEYETATAHELKARYGHERFDRKQTKVQNFVRDLMRIQAEIMAEHFSREQLESMTGITLPTMEQRDKARSLLARGAQAQQAAAQVQQLAQSPQAQQLAQAAPQAAQMAQQAIPQLLPQDPLKGLPPEVVANMQLVANSITWEEVSGVLRSDDRRCYSIDVETNITGYEDSETDKKQRLELAATIKGLMAEGIQAIASAPATAQFTKALIMNTIKGFKVGRDLEDSIESTLDAVMKPGGIAPPPPSPEERMLQAKLASDQKLAEIRVQEHEELSKMRIQEMALELQLTQAKIELQKQALGLKAAANVDERSNKAADTALKQAETQLKTVKVIEKHQAQNPVQGF